MSIVDLDRQQGFALLAEVTSTRNLLAYGVRVIRTGAFIETTRDPILTMLSIGVEKLYKLTLGAIALDRVHKWPSLAEMKAMGHGVAEMHEAVLSELRTRTEGNSQYVHQLVAAVDGDLVVPPVIRTLDVYGRMGRFYYLDELGDRPQVVNPDNVWQEIEDAALSDPHVAALYQLTVDRLGDHDVWNQFTEALNERIAAAVERVWIMVAHCGVNGAFGETGITIGHEIHPSAVGRQ